MGTSTEKLALETKFWSSSLGMSRWLSSINPRFWNPLATIAVFFLLWEGLAAWSRGNGFVTLTAVLPALGDIVQGASFWSSLYFTVGTTLVGLLLGTVVAISVGVPLALSPFLEKSARGTINFGRAIPTIVLLPLLLASLGSRESVVSLLIIFGVSLKMVVFVIRGVHDFPKGFADQVKILGIGLSLHVLVLRMPSASAIILSGMRQTVSRAYGVVLLAGLIAGTPGFGRDINLANLKGADDALLAYVLLAGIVSVALYRLLVWAERLVVGWRVAA